MISINTRPSPVSWTKNPIVFVFGFSGMTIGWKLQVQVINPSNSAVLAEVQYPFNTASGSISIDFKDILDPLVSFVLPTNPASNTPQLVNGHIRSVKLRYKPIYTNSTDPWITDGNIHIIVKGGISYLNKSKNFDLNIGATFTGSKFFPCSTHQYLTHQVTQLLAVEQHAWLVFYQSVLAARYIDFIITYTDGSTSQWRNPTTIIPGQHLAYWIPIGINQNNLVAINPAKTIHYYEVQIVDTTIFLPVPIQTIQRIYVDHRPKYDTMNLIYRNSIGGLESFLIQGKIEIRVESEKGEYEQLPDSNGETPYYYSDMRIIWKANTGFISDDRILQLAELINSLDLYIVLQDDFIPLRIKNKEAVLRSNFTKTYNMDIEFESAASYQTLPKDFLVL